MWSQHRFWRWSAAVDEGYLAIEIDSTNVLFVRHSYSFGREVVHQTTRAACKTPPDGFAVPGRIWQEVEAALS